MSERFARALDISEFDAAVVVRFLDHKIMNDDRMEWMAVELSRLVDKLGNRELRLDFSNVEYLQSSVLGKLVSLHKKAAAAGGRLVLCNIGPDAYKVFAVTKLDKLFLIEPIKAVNEA